MRIGELATSAGVNIQTLRYYERRGLLPEPERSSAGFREYTATQARRVRFIKRAQGLGFTLEEIGELLSLWGDSATSCSAVEARATRTAQCIEAKMADLRRMQAALGEFVIACRGSSSLEDCPLLVGLGGREDSDADR